MKRLLFILLLATAITILFTGCRTMNKNQSGNETAYNKISAQEAKSIIESEDVIILDVRTREEYNEGHIENSVLLPVNEIASKAEENCRTRMQNTCILQERKQECQSSQTINKNGIYKCL